jgi:argininosuccinate synthase
MVYNGHWYDPAFEALRAFFISTQHRVCGETRIAFYKGNVIIEGRRSPFALYDAAVATMDGETQAYRQEDALGFIRLHGLPLRL